MATVILPRSPPHCKVPKICVWVIDFCEFFNLLQCDIFLFLCSFYSKPLLHFSCLTVSWELFCGIIMSFVTSQFHHAVSWRNDHEPSYFAFMNEPPPYPSLKDEITGDFSSRTLLPRQSPSASRYHGVGKSSVEVRQISTATSKNRPHFYGSANYVPANRNVTNSRGSVGSVAAAKTSQHSLHSGNNSRQSLSKNRFLLVINFVLSSL